MADALRQLVSLTRAALDGIGRSLRGNWGLALVSLFLAVGLWVFITEGENPSRTGLFPISIPVEPTNVPPGLALVGPTQPVRVRITAPEDVWDRLSADNFRALADLSQTNEGEQAAPVHVQVVGVDDVRVESVLPDRVVVRLGTWVSRSVPVVVNLVSSPALGYEAGTPSSNPQQVTVAGAEELVSQVEAAVVDLNVFGATAKIERQIKLAPRDSRGLVVGGVTMSPDTAQVGLAVEKKVFTSSFAVMTSLRGAPAPGYNVANIRVEPATITLSGAQEALASLTAVATLEVDISGATSDVVRPVNLSLPMEIRPLGSETVLVWVSIAPATGEAVFGVAPRSTGLDASLALRTTVSTVEVRLAGPLPQLAALAPGQIVATLDLSGLAKGNHSVKPQVQVPSGLRLVAVSPESVEVELIPS